MIATAKRHRSRPAIAAAALLVFGTAFGPAAAPAFAENPIEVDQVMEGRLPSFAPLIERVSPAVVSINVTTRSENVDLRGTPLDPDQLPEEFGDLFREFRRFMDPEPREGRSLGSGFFISADGHVVTNNHVVENATEITVSLSDGEEYDARVLGTDPETDLAVIKVDADEDFKFVEFAADARPRVGDWVVAVGNPFGLGGTATVGIVSATGREIFNPQQPSNYNDFIQTDASINRGNSGGPTFDLEGRVIGVNSQILSPTGGNVGIGLAIPAQVALKVTEDLIENGRVVRGWLGVQIQSLDEDLAGTFGLDEPRGALVASVVEGSPAEEAGFREQDLVLELQGEEVESSLDLTRRVGDLDVGESARFKILREGRERTIRVRIGERPDSANLRERSSISVGDDEELLGMSLRRPDDEDRRRLGLSSTDGAVIVHRVARGGPAAEKGVRPGEAILQIAGEAVSSEQDVRDAIDAARDAGEDAVLVRVQNQAGVRFVALPLDSADG